MTAPRRDLGCPVCGAELTVEQIFLDGEVRQAFAQLAAVSVPIGARILSYLTLFKPPKNQHSIVRKTKLILQLLPDLQRQLITVAGRDWHAPLAAWQIAIDQMLAARDQGKLTLPLTSHGYLYSVLRGMADKVEASDERATHQQRRERKPGASGADIGRVLDEMQPELEATQRAIAAGPRPPAPPPGSSPFVREAKAAIARQKGEGNA